MNFHLTGLENWNHTGNSNPIFELVADIFPIAIDQVLFMQNTSPIPDEMLAHRLGLVPLISRNVIKGLRYTRVSRTFLVLFHMRVVRMKKEGYLERP